MDQLKANTELWSAYLSQEWESWLGVTRMDTTPAARRTAAMIAAAWTPWLAAVTRRPSPKGSR